MTTLIIVCIVASSLCFALGILIAEVVNNRNFVIDKTLWKK